MGFLAGLSTYALLFFAVLGGIVSLPAAPLALVIWLIALARGGREYASAGVWVAVACVGTFAAFGRFSWWW